MKQMCILIFALMSSVVGFAQLSEVKGVETKLVVYDGTTYDYDETEWFGYSFYNMNGFSVSVEAELYMIYYQEKYYSTTGTSYYYTYETMLIDTKTFNLASKEIYIWKQEHDFNFRASDRSYPCYERVENRKAFKYYVKYKAYKLQ